MKKQYIAPSMFAVKLQGMNSILTASTNTITDTPDVTVDTSTITGGDAGGADVKSNTNVWDEEW